MSSEQLLCNLPILISDLVRFKGWRVQMPSFKRNLPACTLKVLKYRQRTVSMLQVLISTGNLTLYF